MNVTNLYFTYADWGLLGCGNFLEALLCQIEVIRLHIVFFFFSVGLRCMGWAAGPNICLFCIIRKGWIDSGLITIVCKELQHFWLDKMVCRVIWRINDRICALHHIYILFRHVRRYSECLGFRDLWMYQEWGFNSFSFFLGFNSTVFWI